MQYVTETYGPTPAGAEAGRPDAIADYLQFLTFGEASMAAYLNPADRHDVHGPDDQKENFTVEAAKGMFLRRLGAVEKKLDEGRLPGRRLHRRRHLGGLCARHRREVRPGRPLFRPAQSLFRAPEGPPRLPGRRGEVAASTARAGPTMLNPARYSARCAPRSGPIHDTKSTQSGAEGAEPYRRVSAVFVLLRLN